MNRKHAPQRPKIVRVGSTPISPIAAKEKREIGQRIPKYQQELRQRSPESHGKVVDNISHSIEDGTLFFNVTFKDKTNLSLRFACKISIVGADFTDTRTGDLEIIREYMKPLPR